MDIYRTLATLTQGRQESIYEYFERFNYYLDRCPNHGFQLHELMKFYLHGMSMGELRIMDVMAGGSIMDRTPTEVWYLIQDRAAETRPYTQYIYSQQSPEEKAYQLALARKATAIAYYKAELEAEMAELERKLEEITKNKRELKSAPEPTRFSPDDEEKIPSIKEQADEDIMEEEFGVNEDIIEEELQVVPIMSTADVPTERISQQCSDIIIEQNTVITRNPIIPHISQYLVFSLTMQNDTIRETLCNIQVWGSLEKVALQISIVRTPMRMLKSERFLVSLCINWKTRKKYMRGSSREIAFHTHKACTLRQTRRQEKWSDGLHRTWKKRKKGKFIHLDAEFSIFSIHVQKNRSEFGWKPGWTWRSISHQVAWNGRKPVQKYDGVHPWAPNLC